MPEVLAYRQKCLAKLESPSSETNCKVIEIACNLANEDWPSKLYQHGFNPNNPTLWLAEGLLPYLTEQEIRELFSRIRKLSSRESHIAFDLISTRFQKVMKISHFALDDEEEVRRIFTEFGCEDIECISFEKLGAMHGREVSGNLTFIVNAKLSSQDFPSQN
jgi:methyltransferase (TIGR00027 family)